ncbi:MAG: hypothetical protein LBQ14_05235 [Treponema sp.]|jgi:hypothetical protein|nr:hypothetical protein [Treponema sp.]
MEIVQKPGFPNSPNAYMRKIVLVFMAFSFFTDTIILPDEIDQPTPPKPPVLPVIPIVPGAPEKIEYQKIPTAPSFSLIQNNQDNREVIEIENYELTVSKAFPGGDTRRNVSGTIKRMQYTLYSIKISH